MSKKTIVAVRRLKRKGPNRIAATPAAPTKARKARLTTAVIPGDRHTQRQQDQVMAATKTLTLTWRIVDGKLIGKWIL